MDRYPPAMPPYANAQQPGDAASHPPNPHPHTLLKVTSEQNVRLHQPPVHPVCQEVKPRLTKEQHDILEAHFQQQHKPSTTTKKGFAESLGVPLEKINNWFQNRRAKVKQDMKKQMAQYNMQLQMQQQQQQPSQQQQQQQQQQPPQQQPQMPQQQIPMHSQMQPAPQSAPQSQPQRPEFSYGPPDMSSSSLPGNGFAVQQAPEMMAPQMPPQDYSSGHGHVLSSISESTQPGSYDAVMQSLVNAGYPVQVSSANGMPSGLQPTDPFVSFDGSNIPHSMGGDSHFAFADFPGSDPFGDGLGDFGADHFDFNTLASSAPASFSGNHARATASTETSPFSAGQSIQNGGSSATSVQSGWMDNQREDSQEGSISGSVPGPGGQWMANHFQPQSVYQQSNTSNQTLISTAADPSESSMYQFSQPDFNQPFAFSDEALHRRDSPATALAQSMGNVELQGQSNSDAGFKQPDQPSSIAARRQRPRPAALGQAALRSASYSAGMPSSPGTNNHNLKADHTLRRIRSTGLVNGGRIQKANTGSAQRSPMHFTFAEAAVSPKFATSSYGGPSISGPPVSTGSLAPPTPLTPSEPGRFPSWQSPGNVQSNVTSNQDTTSRADGAGVLYSMAPTSAAFSTASPPETPLSLASLYGHGHRARVSNGSLVRDTPPQSAPAQQQSFPRSAFTPQQTSMAEEPHQPPPQPHPHPQLQLHPQQHHLHHHQSMENTHSQLMLQQQAQRRPSLPEGGMVPYDMAAMQYAVPMVNADGDLQLAHPMQFAQDPSMNYAKPSIAFSPDMGNGPMQHHMGMQQQNFYVHQYSPPDSSSAQGGQANSRRQSEMQPKNYIFANQTPGDFKA
ncbi:Homeobox protein HD-5 [Lasiodiplodia theobromae]|uniref:Homeobox protein HD-5 n=1 Tax=Lasiodiplodia theobromae TaxID=45133 RepID=A0A5N5DIE5_9PEZI|nr:Homeobox protein HD-5 [Lasiodiplodia theobromae]